MEHPRASTACVSLDSKARVLVIPTTEFYAPVWNTLFASYCRIETLGASPWSFLDLIFFKYMSFLLRTWWLADPYYCSKDAIRCLFFLWLSSLFLICQSCKKKVHISKPCADLPFSVCIVYTKTISYFYFFSFLNASFKWINYNHVSRSLWMNFITSSHLVFFPFA